MLWDMGHLPERHKRFVAVGEMPGTHRTTRNLEERLNLSQRSGQAVLTKVTDGNPPADT